MYELQLSCINCPKRVKKQRVLEKKDTGRLSQNFSFGKASGERKTDEEMKGAVNVSAGHHQGRKKVMAPLGYPNNSISKNVKFGKLCQCKPQNFCQYQIQPKGKGNAVKQYTNYYTGVLDFYRNMPGKNYIIEKTYSYITGRYSFTGDKSLYKLFNSLEIENRWYFLRGISHVSNVFVSTFANIGLE
jgi:hypothetical protein